MVAQAGVDEPATGARDVVGKCDDQNLADGDGGHDGESQLIECDGGQIHNNTPKNTWSQC